jgi:hypothetical protein
MQKRTLAVLGVRRCFRQVSEQAWCGSQLDDEVMLSTANLRLAFTSRKLTARWFGPS